MVFDKVRQALDQLFCPTMAVNHADILKVLCDGICDLLQSGHLIIAECCTRLVVNHTVRADDMFRGTEERDLGIETHMGPVDNIGAVLEAVLQGKVTNNVARAVGGDVVGVNRMQRIFLCEETDRLGAHSPGQVQGAHSQIDSIVRTVFILVTQRDGRSGLGDDVLIIPVDERHKRATTCEAMHAQLRQRGERDIRRQAAGRGLFVSAGSLCWLSVGR